MNNPSPEEIKSARMRAKLTQTKAGEKVFGSLRAWQDYESGQRKMHPAIFGFFLLVTKQKKTEDFL